jgi:hypothetical protein
MIGVIADIADHEIVREFFELFKTPWEFYHPDRQYDILLCNGSVPVRLPAGCAIVAAGRKTPIDRGCLPEENERGGKVLAYGESEIPIYGESIGFAEVGESILTWKISGRCAAYVQRSATAVLARLGYDLFAEVRTLLTAGQPAANAGIPTLDIHIAVLRDLILACGVPLVEIPPVPQGYPFIACLTHDVDHPSIRRHKLDHTVLGFCRRAIWGSLRGFFAGQLPARVLFANWAAVLKLPLIHLGWARDFWEDFDDRYLALENGFRSTFFVIPFRNRPGITREGRAPAFRAAQYGARDIARPIQKLLAAGCEIGLHGIDAWIESGKADEEVAEIRRLTGTREIGVRMHWLYQDNGSPAILDNAGLAYDSTVGYNQTVGYRAGTTQAYKPANANRMLEVPLHAMDTALFYPAYLGLSPAAASKRLDRMVDHASRSGGCLTTNWHDRSTAPERMWSDCYCRLLGELKLRGAWFATVGQAAAWFRKRRSVVFDCAAGTDVTVVCASGAGSAGVPGLYLRIYTAGGPGEARHYTDVPMEEGVEMRVPLEAICESKTVTRGVI